MKAARALRRVRRRGWIIISTVAVAIAATLIWFFGFFLGSDTSEAQTVTQTATASLQTLQQTVSASGTITPAVQQDVAFEVSGTVTGVYVAAGDTVTAGQTLATVDTLQLNASLLQAQSDLASAQATLAEASDDSDGSDAAVAKVSAASAQVDVAQAAVDDAQTALSGATLVAPANGMITAVNIAVGDKLGSSTSGSSSASKSSTSGSSSGGQSTGAGAGSTGGSGSTSGSSSTSGTSSSSSTSTSGFTLVSTDSWTVDVTVGESDVEHVTAGLQVELSTDDGDKLTGVVQSVAALPSTTDGSAQYPVTISVTGTDTSAATGPGGGSGSGNGGGANSGGSANSASNAGGSSGTTSGTLYDGMSIDASIIYQQRDNVLTVPSAAVTTDGGTSTVVVIGDDGTRTDTTVSTGERSGTLVEITSGLSEGDEVLVAEFTPGEGSGDQQSGEQGQMPGGGQMPDGQMPGGSGGQGGFPGGGSGGQGGFPGAQGGSGQQGGQ